MKELVSAILFSLFIPSILFSQSGSIKGFIYSDETAEIVPFVNISLKNTKHGTASDLNGFFILQKLEPGTYTIQISSLGFQSYTEEIKVENGKQVVKKIYLKSTSTQLKEVEIFTDRTERKNETNVSVEKITTKQVKLMPSIGGQSDLAQYLQVLPGITFTGDQGGQLFVRGGSMIQNKVLLDGVTIYNPFHSIGLFSVFDSDIISSADIYTGGFGAEYGGRISSIMSIRSRDGNRRRHSGKVGISTFGANVMLEGPLKKEQFTNETTITYLFSAKNSYLSKTAPFLYRYSLDASNLPYDFLDLYGKLSLIGPDGSKINVFGFNFTDKVRNYQSIANYGWQNYGFGANFIAIPGPTSILEGIVSYSDYKVEMQSGSTEPSQSNINNFNIGLTMTYFVDKNQIKSGIELEGGQTFYSVTNENGVRFPRNPSPENNTEISSFVQYDANFGKFLLSAGLRGIYYASIPEFSVEPRLAIKYNAFDKVRFKLATGIYSQSLLDVKSDRDVVNLFVGILSGTGNQSIPSQFRGDAVNSFLQKATHVILGMEVDATKHLLLNFEPYYKRFNQLISVNRNKIYENLADYKPNGKNPKPEYLLTDFIIEKGEAYGFDVNAKYDYNRLYIWVSYSLSYVTRTDELQTYHPHFDRRHNLNTLLSYSLGSTKEWEISLRWNYGSGFPFTKTQGGYENIPINSINTDYLVENGNLGILYSSDFLITENGTIVYTKMNNGRLPDYHRMDLMVKRRFSLGRRSILEANISITNVYNRSNIFYFNRVTYDRVNQLPILLSSGINLFF